MTTEKGTIGEMGEFRFIRSIMDGCRFSGENILRGIGDDCAVIGPFGEKVLLVTTDLLVENVHFILEKIRLRDLGWKSAAVNLSDIAAMGGTARHLFLSLAIPRAMPVRTLHSLYQGIKEICRQYGVDILGGDTSASRGGLMISVTALGDAPPGEVLYRNGARPGDRIYVSGTLGDSAAGLKVIREEFSAPADASARLAEAHNLPVPCLAAGRLIARSRLASAMIDISDGLASDLGHVCEESGVGARVSLSAVPLSKELVSVCRQNGADPLDLAVSGGEDYRLLVTVPPKNGPAFERYLEKEDIRFHEVGEITKGKGVVFISEDGARRTPDVSGFDHFSG